jgi:hypothetical protein
MGALAWSKSAAGGRFRHSMTRKGKETEQIGQWSTFLGYIGPKTTKSANHLPSESAYLSPEARGQCFKLGKGSDTDEQETTQRALLYLKLREDGCSKHQSLVFTQRRRCRYDTTKTRDGPSCHRTIALGDNRVQGVNWSGWQLHSPELLISSKYQPIVISEKAEDYDVVTRKFEAMSCRKESNLGTEDEHRDSYFADLSKEWDKRQSKYPKPSRKYALSLSIPEESTPFPLETDCPLTKPLETETTTETKPSFLLSPRHSKIPSLGSDLHSRSQASLRTGYHQRPVRTVKIQHFPSVTITFRSVIPEGSRFRQNRKAHRKGSEFSRFNS